jgi:hypothetical protein
MDPTPLRPLPKVLCSFLIAHRPFECIARSSLHYSLLTWYEKWREQWNSRSRRPRSRSRMHQILLSIQIEFVELGPVRQDSTTYELCMMLQQ